MNLKQILSALEEMATSQALVDAITEMVAKPNKADIPLSMALREGIWYVYIEMDSRRGTFDLEAKGPTLVSALRSAHRSVKRELG